MSIYLIIDSMGIYWRSQNLTVRATKHLIGWWRVRLTQQRLSQIVPILKSGTVPSRTLLYSQPKVYLSLAILACLISTLTSKWSISINTWTWCILILWNAHIRKLLLILLVIESNREKSKRANWSKIWVNKNLKIKSIYWRSKELPSPTSRRWDRSWKTCKSIPKM